MKKSILKGSTWVLGFAVLATGLAASSPGQNPPAQQQAQQPDQQDPAKQDPKKKDKKKDQKPAEAQANSQNPPPGNPPPANPAPANPPPAGTQPKPLFGGSLNLKSSRQTKDTTSLGFNGVGPEGQVEKSMLAAAPSGTDNAKASQVGTYKVADADLNQFIQDGGLPQVPATQKTSN